MPNSSPPYLRHEVLAAQRGSQRLREGAQGAVAGLVTMGVVERLEVVEVGHDEDERRAAAAHRAHLVLEAAPVQEAGEPVGRRLELRLGHHAQHPESVPHLVGEDLQLVDGLVAHRLADCRGHVYDADRTAHDRHRHAHCRARPAGPAPQARAGVEVLAVREHLGLTRAGRHARVGRVDRASRGLAVGCGDRHPLEVGPAVVGRAAVRPGLPARPG